MDILPRRLAAERKKRYRDGLSRGGQRGPVVERRGAYLASGIPRWYQATWQAAWLFRFYRGFLSIPSSPLGSATAAFGL
jgi:hypothetical protein